MKEAIIQWIRSFYTHKKGSITTFDTDAYQDQAIFWAIGMFIVLTAFAVIAWYVSRVILIRILHLVVDKTKTTLDQYLVQHKVFRSLAHLVPLMFMDYFLSIVLYHFPATHGGISKLVSSLIIFAILLSVNRGLNAFRDVILDKEVYADKPIHAYFQVVKIIVSGILSVMILSIVTEKSPLFLFTSLGAISAILIIIFKDSILGFVGSIQLSANNMIRIGDWVTMEKYGADGEVKEINLATVKVRNFDKTITTIPTYSFISDSFINWRGMQESNGRRIKRAINIQIDSIHFASEELIEKLKRIRILKDFIEEREKEIQEYNEIHGFKGEDAINARRQTNIGLYRRYIEYYLKHNENVNSSMEMVVRQLTPGVTGIPIEIYCFTKTKQWNEYESTMADIFDHIFAITPMFDLVIFESPTGRDLRSASI